MKNLFRRSRAGGTNAAADGPLDAGDQWFRPDASATGRAAAAAAKPTPDDAPTESFVPPKGWLESGKPAAKAPVKGSGAGAGKAANSGGGAGRGPGRGGAAAAGSAPKGAPKKKRKKKHRVQKAMWALLSIAAIGFFMLLVAYSRLDVPAANEVATQQTTQVFYADDETPVGRLGETNRTIVGLDKMPVHLRDAVLAIENRSFYTDNGVSPKGMARAFWNNLTGGSTQGGSTITQQYVKNTYLTTERSISRKFKEALLAIKIDRDKSKDQILEDYLNTIYLGRGAYGVQAAAKAYWNKDVQDVDVSQGAALAAIIVRPSAYDPSEPDGLDRLESRWGIVLDSMVETGKLTPEVRETLTFPKFPKQPQAASRFGGQKGYILTMVRQELEARGMNRDDIENGGFRIVTTLDPQAQQAAEDAVAEEFPETDDKKLTRNLRVGLASVDPKNGAIRAMYGGKDFLGENRYAQVNTATYPIQAGSTMKIFTTAAALESGRTLSSPFNGRSPLILPGSKPVQNQFNRGFGTVTLKRALESSINTAFVDVVTKIGATTVEKAMIKAGIPKDTPGLEPNARITLGIASTPPVEVASALGTICGGGVRNEHHIVERVIGANGGEVPITKPEQSNGPVFTPEAVAGTLEAMQSVVEVGTGTAAKRLGRPAAGKTGNHEGLTVWFSGCTPQLATSVNYFYKDGTKDLPLVNGRAFAGGTFPAETWTTYMRDALRGVSVEPFPKVQNEDEPTAKPTEDPFGEDIGGFDPGEEPPPVAPPVTTPDFPVFVPPPVTVPSPDPPTAEECADDPDRSDCPTAQECAADPDTAGCPPPPPDCTADPEAAGCPPVQTIDCSLAENQGRPECPPPAECQDTNENQQVPPFNGDCDNGELPEDNEAPARGNRPPGAQPPAQTPDPEDDA